MHNIGLDQTEEFFPQFHEGPHGAIQAPTGLTQSEYEDRVRQAVGKFTGGAVNGRLVVKVVPVDKEVVTCKFYVETT